MSNINRELNNKEEYASYADIQKRAYELYLARGGEDGQDIEDWLFAEEQLRGERIGKKTTDFVAGTGGVAITDSPSDNNLIIAEEERRQVPAAEESKEAQHVSAVPRTKAVSVGQQRNK